MIPKECKRLAEVYSKAQPMQIREERAPYSKLGWVQGEEGRGMG